MVTTREIIERLQSYERTHGVCVVSSISRVQSDNPAEIDFTFHVAPPKAENRLTVDTLVTGKYLETLKCRIVSDAVTMNEAAKQSLLYTNYLHKGKLTAHIEIAEEIGYKLKADIQQYDKVYIVRKITINDIPLYEGKAEKYMPEQKAEEE